MGALFALLTRIPAIGGLLLRLTTWITQRKWGVWLSFFIMGAAGQFIGKLLTWAGVYFVSSEFATPHMIPLVSGPLLGMPDPFPALLGLTKIDQAATVILSAIAAKLISKISIRRNPQAPGWTTSPGAGP